MSDARIEVSKDGPYLVSGDLPLFEETIVTDELGESVAWQRGQDFEHNADYALCRCGHSGNKPFCDGTHKKTGFDGTETASREPHIAGAKPYTGPTMDMLDNPVFCAVARFCDARGKAWSNVKRTDTEEGRDIVGTEAQLCPSGRLVAVDKATGEPVTLEPELEPSIATVEDPAEGCSGPLWVRGEVEVVGADGEAYEARNRMTLCRCGLSSNKPFCDATHADVGWKAD